MKIKTSELTGAALDWAVQKCLTGEWYPYIKPSSDWAQGGPIIERERVNFIEGEAETWDAWVGSAESADLFNGPTPLIAAMRCYVASRLGDEIDVPDELINQTA